MWVAYHKQTWGNSNMQYVMVIDYYRVHGFRVIVIDEANHGCNSNSNR